MQQRKEDFVLTLKGVKLALSGKMNSKSSSNQGFMFMELDGKSKQIKFFVSNEDVAKKFSKYTDKPVCRILLFEDATLTREMYPAEDKEADDLIKRDEEGEPVYWWKLDLLEREDGEKPKIRLVKDEAGNHVTVPNPYYKEQNAFDLIEDEW